MCALTCVCSQEVEHFYTSASCCQHPSSSTRWCVALHCLACAAQRKNIYCVQPLPLQETQEMRPRSSFVSEQTLLDLRRHREPRRDCVRSLHGTAPSRRPMLGFAIWASKPWTSTPAINGCVGGVGGGVGCWAAGFVQRIATGEFFHLRQMGV